MAVTIALTGRPRVEVDGVPDPGLGQLPGLVLAYLVSERDRPVPRDQLAEVLWGSALPATWDAALRVHVTKVRAVLRASGFAKDALVTRDGCYRLHLPPGTAVDVDTAAGALEDAAADLAAADPHAARRAAMSAAAIAGRQFLPGVRGAWVEQRQREILELRLQALDLLARAACEIGDLPTAIRAGEEAIAAEPFRETAYLNVMDAHSRAGNRGEALRVYERCRRALGEHLGVGPSPATEAAYLSLLGDEPTDTGLPTGVVTFLLTDIEGSTAMWEADAGAMAVALECHDAIVARVVSENRGELIKSKGEGDSTLSVFARASDAAAAAVALGRTLRDEPWPAQLELRVRTGVHTGEAQLRDGDYYGPTVNRAARIRGVASGGQVLVSQACAALIADHLPDGQVLVARGRHELKGMARAEDLFELTAPERERPPVSVPQLALPAMLRTVEPFAFAGRTPERQLLLDACEEATNLENVPVVLVAGEPGAGKTRIAAEVAQVVHQRGATVLAGRCDDGMALAYQPFIQALREVSDSLQGAELEASLGPLAHELRRIDPQLATHLPGLAEPLSADPDTERHQLFEAVVDWLATLGAHHPVVLILDDLQWATTPTLLLLRHVVRARPRSSLAIIGIYRDTELTPRHPLAELISDLSRERSFTPLALAGLDAAAVGELVAEAGGQPLDAEGSRLAFAVHRESEGNPFFVGEILRHLDEAGQLRGPDGEWGRYRDISDVGIPEGVRRVVMQRVARLPEAAVRALTVASVIGSEFDLGVVSIVTDTGEDDVLDAIEDAQAARLVVERPDEFGAFAFSHAIVRSTLLEGLSRTRRVRLHRAIGDAIEQVHADDLDGHAVALAYHFGHVAEGGRGAMQQAAVAKAIVYSHRAGDRALAALAPDDALRHYQSALALQTASGDIDEPLVIDLCIGLGSAQRQLGDPASRDILLDAAHRALALGDASRVVGAALANNRGVFSSVGEVDDDKIDVLENALELLPADDLDRALVLATLCQELTFAGSFERRRTLADEALTMAESSGDDGLIVRVLQQVQDALRVPAMIERLSAQTADALVRAGRIGDPVAVFWTATQRLSTVLCAGDIDGVDRCLEVAGPLAEQVGQPIMRWTHRYQQATRAQVAGDSDLAETLATEAFEIGSLAGEPDVETIFGPQLIAVSFLRGTMGDLVPMIAAAAAENPRLPAFLAGLAMAYAEADRTEDAQRLLSKLATSDFELPMDFNWTMAMVCYAEAAIECRDSTCAEALSSLLAPWATQLCSNDVMCAGPVTHFLGGLAGVLGRRDEADAYFTHAAEFNERADAKFFAARTHLSWGTMLAEDPDRGDPTRARELLTSAVAVASRHGYANVERRASAALAALA